MDSEGWRALILGILIFSGVIGFLLYLLTKSIEIFTGELYRWDVDARYPEAYLIDDEAYLVIQEGAARNKPRKKGRGALMLSPDALLFELWWPRHLFRIPLEQIQSTQLVTNYKHQLGSRPLLRVNFLNKAGEEAFAIWKIEDIERFRQNIGK